MTISGTLYQCTAGETFDSVALEVYGDEVYAWELMSANPEYSTTPIFTGGELLELPVIEVPSDDDVEEEEYVSTTPPWKE